MAKSVPPIEFSLSLETALTLVDVMLQQQQHAINADKQGYPVLLEQFNKLLPFFNFLLEYTNKHAK